jgi:hypothetical protein
MKKLPVCFVIFTLVLAATVFRLAELTHAEGNTPVVFSDGDFLSGWIDISGVTDDPFVPGQGPGTSSFKGSSVPNNGGNPGTFRETTHTITYGDRIYSGGLNTSAIYSPSNSGTIYSITFSSDLIHPYSDAVSGWWLILEQEGVIYFAVRGLPFYKATWEPFTIHSLKEQDFDTAPPKLEPNNEPPDFSPNGGPITFGYIFTNDMEGPGKITLSHGIDNWLIIVNPDQIFLPMIAR